MPLQICGQRDTIRISEVVIRSKQIPSDLPGFKKIRIDSVLQNNYNHFSLSELLSESSPLFIKSYGYGGSAISSFRGSGASHTLVTWNGIGINNPMLGQSDFSLFSAGMIDNVQIYYGGASLFDGSGGFGGTVNLENKPVWTENSQLYLSPGIGSFGRYSGSVKFRSGNNTFQTVTKVYLNSSENNFPYLNDVASSEPVREEQKNNQIFHKEFLEEFFYKRDSDVLTALLWYQSTSRNLPGSMLVSKTENNEKQYDESFRSLLGYDFNKDKMRISVKGSWMVTKLDYTNSIASINSHNLANTFVLKGTLETSVKKSAKINVIISDELNVIESNNYATNISHNNALVSVFARVKNGNRFGSTFLLREILDGRSLLLPDFSAGFEYRLFNGEESYLKSSVTRNSRIPSLNDRYWTPGGNADLKNEYAYEYEIGYNFRKTLPTAFSVNAEITCFHNCIRDMIQWQPGEFSYWTAQNIGRVNASGLESVFSLKYKYDKLDFKFNSGYSFTKSVSVSTEEPNDRKQLMYVPKNQANGSFQVTYGKLYISWITCFTGKRYITVDNNGYLPGYTVNNLLSGIKIDRRKIDAGLNFKVENIFNKTYQTIAYYPQPGRYFFISISFQLTKQ